MASIDDTYTLVANCKNELTALGNQIKALVESHKCNCSNTDQKLDSIKSDLSEQLDEIEAGLATTMGNAVTQFNRNNETLSGINSSLNSVKNSLQTTSNEFTSTKDALDEQASNLKKVVEGTSDSMKNACDDLNKQAVAVTSSLASVVQSANVSINDSVNELKNQAASLGISVSGAVCDKLVELLQPSFAKVTSDINMVLAENARVLTRTSEIISDTLSQLVEANNENERLELIASARCEELRSALQVTNSLSRDIDNLNKRYSVLSDSLNQLIPYLNAQIDVLRQNSESSKSKETVVASSAAAASIATVLEKILGNGSKGGKF